jgi:hypothetical protein
MLTTKMFIAFFLLASSISLHGMQGSPVKVAVATPAPVQVSRADTSSIVRVSSLVELLNLLNSPIAGYAPGLFVIAREKAKELKEKGNPGAAALSVLVSRAVSGQGQASPKSPVAPAYHYLRDATADKETKQ